MDVSRNDMLSELASDAGLERTERQILPFRVVDAVYQRHDPVARFQKHDLSLFRRADPRREYFWRVDRG